MKKIKNMYNRVKNIIKYSDTDLLEIFMNLDIIILNPLIFSSTSADYPMWLIFIGIPFAMFSLYKLFVNCSRGRDLSYLLTIGQLAGIMVLVQDDKSLFYPVLCEIIVFGYLRWRASVDVKRMNKRGL